MQIDLFPLWLSLRIAVIAVTIVFFLSLFLARFFVKKDFFGKDFIEALITLPMVLPPTVIGLILLVLFGKNGIFGIMLKELFNIELVFNWLGGVIAAIVVAFPLMYQSAVAGFKSVDPKLELVAETLGASKLKVFWTVVVPLTWPSLLSGLVLSFTRGLGEFGASMMVMGFVPGKTNTLPIEIFFAVQRGDIKGATIWAVVLIIFSLLVIYFLGFWSKKNLLKFMGDRVGVK